MLSTADLERLIAVKRREIEKEKTRLGLPPRSDDTNKENAAPSPTRKKVSGERAVPAEQNEQKNGQREGETEEIPPDLERYIRRYLGLPVMLKAGEYSPNNPLIRGERPSGDALLGLGEYERRRNTLRKLRQQQYREYLDQQAKKKQEEKEQAERERREREQREREQEEREKEKELERVERDRISPERPRAYTNTVFSAMQNLTSKVDTGVQTNTIGKPLSVAVQTDDAELYRLSSPTTCPLTTAERELSPRTVVPERRSLPDLEQGWCRARYRPSLLDADAVQQRNERAEQEAAAKRQFYQQELKNQILEQQRIREERKAREKLLEAAEMRRLEEQLRMLRGAQESELHKHRAREHQMKENATDYEKKRTALQKEIDQERQSLFRAPRHSHTSHSDGLPSKLPVKLPSKLPFYYPSIHAKKSEKKHFSTNIPDGSIFSPNYDVDGYLRKNLNPSKEMLSSRLETASTESLASKYLDRYERPDRFNDMYKDVSNKRVVEALVHDRPKSNPKSDNPMNKGYSKENDNPIEAYPRGSDTVPKAFPRGNHYTTKTFPRDSDNTTTKALGSDDTNPKAFPRESDSVVPKAFPRVSDNSKAYPKESDIPIPVLRHSPLNMKNVEKNTDLSKAMQVVDDKWKVPAVQKNILKSLPNEEGKSVSILTQLGSIRRQLQLEQLRLDEMLTKH